MVVTGRITVHAYPWDVLGDPEAVDRLRGIGADDVTVAAAYHSVRAATPRHPRHMLVTAAHAALYRPVRPQAWAGRAVAPAVAPWSGSADAFGAAVGTLHAEGLPVTAWIVLTHSSRLGAEHPRLAVVNCFGERYDYALCPSNPDVREYAATLAAEAIRGLPVTGVSLEACGQLGLVHGGHHEKTEGAYPPPVERLLSVCCCGACQAGWQDRGLEPAQVRRALRDRVRALLHGKDVAAADLLLDADLAGPLLDTRHEAAGALRRAAVDAVRGEIPAARVALHASPDPWATGASPGLPAKGIGDVDAVVVPCWPAVGAGPQVIRDARAAAPAGVAVGAYVSVLPPVPREDLPPLVRTLLAAGADELHLYHAGLAGPARFPLLEVSSRTAREAWARSRRSTRLG